MVKVEAFIKPFKLDAVKHALARVGVEGMTVCGVQGFGRQRGHTDLYRGVEYAVDFLPKLKLEVVVDDSKGPQVADAIQRAARTGRIGDGKILICSVTEVIRIRTGECGRDAL